MAHQHNIAVRHGCVQMQQMCHETCFDNISKLVGHVILQHAKET